eukprot:169875-Rhodomonas_salina.1
MSVQSARSTTLHGEGRKRDLELEPARPALREAQGRGRRGRHNKRESHQVSGTARPLTSRATCRAPLSHEDDQTHKERDSAGSETGLRVPAGYMSKQAAKKSAGSMEGERAPGPDHTSALSQTGNPTLSLAPA